MSRRRARFIAFQCIYEWDFQKFKKKKTSIDEIIDYNISQLEEEKQKEFILSLVKGVVEKQPALDMMIEKSAPEWPLAQLNLVDRNVLRLGIYELVFSKNDNVPPKVAINEAIEIAKSFGSNSSGRFVNGVLGTIYRELQKVDKKEEKDKKSKKVSKKK